MFGNAIVETATFGIQQEPANPTPWFGPANAAAAGIAHPRTQPAAPGLRLAATGVSAKPVRVPADDEG
jgi:hypothetical protein